MRAFLKHLPKNISAILTIFDDVSILRFRYTLRSNPEHGHSGGRDLSNFEKHAIKVNLTAGRPIELFVYGVFFACLSLSSQLMHRFGQPTICM